MSIEEKILQRILTAGSLGVKKTDLRREFETAELTILLENLISRGEVFVDKKGAAYYCWHREHYMENLLNSDQKFRLVYSSVKSLEDSINRTSDGLARTVEALACNISNLAKLVVEQGNQRAVSNNPHANMQTHSYSTTTVDEFKKDFDTAI